MPVSKKTKAAHLAAGQCSLCTNPLARLATGKLSRFCAGHLLYFKNYRKHWKDENAGPRKNRCAVCREVGHTIQECDDPRADAMRAQMGLARQQVR